MVYLGGAVLAGIMKVILVYALSRKMVYKAVWDQENKYRKETQ